MVQLNLFWFILFLIIAVVLGVFIGIIISIIRYSKNVPYAGNVLLDWNIIDPSNVSIENPKNITQWQNYKRLCFDVHVRHDPKRR